jgi:glycosidase
MMFPFTRSKLDWSINPDVTAEYKKIIAFRNESEAVRRGELTSYSSDDVCAFTKVDGGDKVLVISNLRNKALDYAIPVNLVGTKWKNVFTGKKMKLGDKLTLDAYTYWVMKN